ncbi:uncharacterized protein HD556DRAFT_1534237 [Suillus plorans]|uniref:Uncharacterized protein n=1 Tax=Suillus plorans TaxID=116603 RepID=A0A9P7DQ74_9AGAM|nr:uncharacterized protein HD556DRAFT_1534237 [Suillus plorans]KAG1800375.1 hypothetical protein HD556DRAFT_1534237 [Suillus plorans]
MSSRRNDNPPPYSPSSSEADPLIGPRKPYRRYRSPYLYVALIVLFIIAIMAFNFSTSLSNDPLDPDVRERIRKDWDIELRQHQKEVLERIDTQKRWRVEDNERINLREQWGAEVEKHNREVEDRLKRDEEHKSHMHEQWKRETEEHKKEVEELRRREEQDRIILREKWSREVEEHEREVEERRKHEEEERLRLNMFWTDLASHTCTTYATREYTARLVNVPSYYNRRVEACMTTPVKIHGVEYMPKWCEDHGPNDVIGHWEVDQHEPDCASYWIRYKNLGCISPGSGQRRIEHYLEHLPSGADWKEFCATTPANFLGMHFMGSEFCFQNKGGTYGHWVFDDESCK